MPKSHRNFLENLEHGVSVRAYCLREWRKVPRFSSIGSHIARIASWAIWPGESKLINNGRGQILVSCFWDCFLSMQKHRQVSLPEFLCTLGSLQVPVEGIAALEDAFNNCIESLLKYCSLRQRRLERRYHETVAVQCRNCCQVQVTFIRLFCNVEKKSPSSENLCLGEPQEPWPATFDDDSTETHQASTKTFKKDPSGFYD